MAIVNMFNKIVEVWCCSVLQIVASHQGGGLAEENPRTLVIVRS